MTSKCADPQRNASLPALGEGNIFKSDARQMFTFTGSRPLYRNKRMLTKR